MIFFPKKLRRQLHLDGRGDADAADAAAAAAKKEEDFFAEQESMPATPVLPAQSLQTKVMWTDSA